MAIRTLLYALDPTYKCFSSTLCHRTKSSTNNLYEQIRGFKRIRRDPKEIETELPHVEIKSGSVGYSKLWKPFGFTILFSGATMATAAIWEYERIRAKTLRVINHYRYYRIHKTGFRGAMQQWWRNLTEGQKVFIPICFANLLVFLAWRVPSLKHVMMKYFTVSPNSSALCWPMLLSTFSHHSLFHLAANMYVLHSFCTMAAAGLGKEQFVAFYLSSGVVSSFASQVYKTVFALSSPSLGASGAIMGILGYVCTQYPDIRLGIIFLPMYTFTAGAAMKTIMGIDAVGCILKWQLLDHAAHLGGAACGIFWQCWGNAHIWQKREPLLTFWHNLRDPPRSH